MITKNEIRPSSKRKVFDLVTEAGFDTTDWIKSWKGSGSYKANPKYCYNWAFEQSGKFVILSLWHEEMYDEDDTVWLRGNFRMDAEANRQRAHWYRRGMNLDRALRIAVADSLAVRVIINAGKRRAQGDPLAEPSKVEKRGLDPEPWAVSEYDDSTGEFRLVRGRPQPRFVDQFDLRLPNDAEVTRRERSSAVYSRSSEIRSHVMHRSNGRCEYCETKGFVTANGSIYLETHHVIPLSEKGKDSVFNVIALCPNHHREAHYGAEKATIRARMLRKIEDSENNPK